MQSLSSDEIKRQILKSVDTSPIKKRMDKSPPGISIGEQIEIGNELDKMTRMGGWAIVEQYMLDKMNLIGLAVQDGSDLNRGIAKAFIELMQWIKLNIDRRNKLLEQEKIKHEAKNVSKDENE